MLKVYALSLFSISTFYLGKKIDFSRHGFFQHLKGFLYGVEVYSLLEHVQNNVLAPLIYSILYGILSNTFLKERKLIQIARP